MATAPQPSHHDISSAPTTYQRCDPRTHPTSVLGCNERGTLLKRAVTVL